MAPSPSLTNLPSQNHLFRSTKTSAAIQYQHRWQLVFLIGVSLDPSTQSISPVYDSTEFAIRVEAPEPQLKMAFDDKTSSLSARSDQRYRLRSDIEREPGWSNCLTIWSHRSKQCDPSEQMKILNYLSARSHNVSIGELLNDLEIPPDRGKSIIWKLVALGALSVPIDHPINLRTPVERVFASPP
jgi:hypothetical protein